MPEIVNIDASDRRRTWGLILLAGGGMAMTVFASVVLWLVKDNADYAFYLGLCAMALIGVVLTGFAGLLMKRTIRANILGNEVEISDQGNAE
jgi:hypothetical protein